MDKYALILQALGGLDFNTYVNSVMAKKYNEPDTSGFVWDSVLKTELKYEQLSAVASAYSMATYVDVDADAPEKSTQGFEISSGNIPRMKHSFKINENRIREQMLYLQRAGKADKVLTESLEGILFESLDYLIGGNYNSLKYQRHQIVSKGKLVLFDGNNPQGLKNVVIDFNVPEGNRWNKGWWKKNGQEDTSKDPLKDLTETIDTITDDKMRPIHHIEVNAKTWKKFLELPKVREKIGTLSNSFLTDPTEARVQGSLLSRDRCKELIESYLGYEIRVIDSKSVVERYDEATRSVVNIPLQSFAEDVFVFVPSEQIGTIQAARPVVVMDDPNSYALFDGGRTKITQEFNQRKILQYVESELTALCVPNVVDSMFYLEVKADK